LVSRFVVPFFPNILEIRCIDNLVICQDAMGLLLKTPILATDHENSCWHTRSCSWFTHLNVCLILTDPPRLPHAPLRVPVLKGRPPSSTPFLIGGFFGLLLALPDVTVLRLFRWTSISFSHSPFFSGDRASERCFPSCITLRPLIPRLLALNLDKAVGNFVCCCAILLFPRFHIAYIILLRWVFVFIVYETVA